MPCSIGSGGQARAKAPPPLSALPELRPRPIDRTAESTHPALAALADAKTPFDPHAQVAATTTSPRPHRPRSGGWREVWSSRLRAPVDALATVGAPTIIRTVAKSTHPLFSTSHSALPNPSRSSPSQSALPHELETRRQCAHRPLPDRLGRLVALAGCETADDSGTPPATCARAFPTNGQSGRQSAAESETSEPRSDIRVESLGAGCRGAASSGERLFGPTPAGCSPGRTAHSGTPNGRRPADCHADHADVRKSR